MALKFNEGKACDAVIKRIEAREGATRKNTRFPEKENHSAPVELVCDIGDRTYAFEHTGIEPFHGHIRLQREAKNQLQPIKDALADVLPTTENFELRIPARALEGLKGKKLEKAQRSIIEWIKTTASTLPIAPFGRHITPINQISLPDVPFKVSLLRSASGLRGAGLYFTHFVSTLDDDRLERIREAYTRKVPKLTAWQQDARVCSILILEDNDIQLTNPQLVADAIARIEKDVTEKPDEIYLVVTATADRWWVWAMRINSDGYYALCNVNQSMTEVNPASLRDVTAMSRKE